MTKRQKRERRRDPDLRQAYFAELRNKSPHALQVEMYDCELARIQAGNPKRWNSIDDYLAELRSGKEARTSYREALRRWQEVRRELARFSCHNEIQLITIPREYEVLR